VKGNGIKIIPHKGSVSKRGWGDGGKNDFLKGRG